jgi:hypothetical protein
MNNITIQAPKLQVRGDKARLCAAVTLPEGTQDLWFEIGSSHMHVFADETLDGFVVGLLPLAATRGLDIHAAGPMSSRLRYNINAYLGELLRCLIPSAHRIRVTADSLATHHWGGRGVFTGFSAGIDSFCTVMEHRSDEVPPEYRVSHLLFNNVGSHGQSDHDLRVFRERFQRLKPNADELALPLLRVDSNLDEILGLDFQLTHTLRNVAVALLLQRACGKYLYSSGVHYVDCHVRPTHDVGYADSIILPLLSTETTECISSGGQHTRFEKTRLVSRFVPSRTALDVCVNPAHARLINCSRCWKCLRTQLTLEAIGALGSYRAVFDLESYRNLRTLYISLVLKSQDSLLREVRQGMAEEGLAIPLMARVLSALVPAKILEVALNERSPRAWKLLPRVIRRIARMGLPRRAAHPV